MTVVIMIFKQLVLQFQSPFPIRTHLLESIVSRSALVVTKVTQRTEGVPISTTVVEERETGSETIGKWCKGDEECRWKLVLCLN